MSENTNLVPKRRFKEFQNADAWEQRELGDVANIVGGGTPSTNTDEYWDGDIDWYSPVEIGEKTYVNRSRKTITELGLQKSSAKILPAGTVLFTSRAGIGNTAILTKEGATNQGFQSIVSHIDELDSYFIFSRTHELKRYGETSGAGSTFVEVSGKQMSKMPILLPGMKEQIKIGNFFKRLDGTIALQQRKLEKMKALKSAYLSELFPAEGEQEPKRRFAGFTGAWEQRKVTELGKIFIGLVTTMTANYREDGTLLIRNSDIKDNYFEFSEKPIFLEEQFAENNSNRKLKIGDIVTVHTGDVGTSAVITKNEDGAIGFATINTRPNNKILDSNFLSTYFNSDTHKAFALEMSTGDGRTNYNLKDFFKLVVPLPNLEEQTQIGNFFKQLDDTITFQQRKLEKLQNIKKAYLNEMFI